MVSNHPKHTSPCGSLQVGCNTQMIETRTQYTDRCPKRQIIFTRCWPMPVIPCPSWAILCPTEVSDSFIASCVIWTFRNFPIMFLKIHPTHTFEILSSLQTWKLPALLETVIDEGLGIWCCFMFCFPMIINMHMYVYIYIITYVYIYICKITYVYIHIDLLIYISIYHPPIYMDPAK